MKRANISTDVRAAAALAGGFVALHAPPALAQPEALEPPAAIQAPNPIQNRPGSPSTPEGLSSEGPQIPTVAPVAPNDALPFTTGAIDPDLLYAGFRVDDLVGEPLLGAEGGPVGTVRDLVIARDGRVVSLVAETGGVIDIGNSYFRVPWSDIAIAPGEPGVRVPVTEAAADAYDTFDERDWVRTGRREFRATEVIGDYTSLAGEAGVGIVVDLVVHPEGRLLAALVERRGALGGGIFAYPYVGEEGARSGPAGAELPFDPPTEAGRALAVDPDRFGDPF
jgi:sporulation protein YlmC with PRC-barrel domain